jgi:hypothetical protein
MSLSESSVVAAAVRTFPACPVTSPLKSLLSVSRFTVSISLRLQLIPTVSKNIAGDSGLLGCNAERLDSDFSNDHNSFIFKVQHLDR